MNKVLLLVSALLMASCATQPEPSFKKKYETASTGSHIRRNAVLAELPFDKSYEQLTLEQQALVKSAYKDLPKGVEPPFPRDGVGVIADELKKAVQVIPVTGELFAVAQVDALGAVQSVSFFSAPNKNIAEAVSRILVSTPFKPASCNGVPCQMAYPLQLSFK